MIKKFFLFASLMLLFAFSIYAAETRTIETFPYSENFNSPSLPTGWTIEDTDADGITWSPSISDWGNPGDYALCCDYTSNNSKNDWAFSPGILFTNGKIYRLQFLVKCQDQNYVEKMEVKWGNSPSSASMNATLYSVTPIGNSVYEQVTLWLNIPARSDESRSYYYIGWHALSDIDEWYLWLDNVTIEEASQTPVFHSDTSSYDFGNQQISYRSFPKTINISNAGLGELYISSCAMIGADSSEFEFIYDHSDTGYLIALDVVEFNIIFHPHTLGTKSVILRFMENGTIAHDIPITGTSVENTVSTFPYLQNFETGSLPSEWIKYSDGAGWRIGDNMHWGDPYFSIPAHTKYIAVDKFTDRWLYDPLPGRNDYLTPPPFNLTLGNGIPHLYFSSYFTNYEGEQAHVEYSLDGENWISLQGMVPGNTWTQAPIDINLYAFRTCPRFFIRFHADDMGNENATGWAIDDVKVEFLPYAPTNVHLTRTSITVHITWDAVQNINGYRVYSAPEPYSDLWTLETPTPITQTSWTGNSSQSRKFFKIVSVR